MRIIDFTVHDLRFPTSAELHGSDAMNPAPDYSCAYVQLQTDTGLSGCGLTFTLGRGTDLCALAIEAHRSLIVGVELEQVKSDPAGFYRRLTGDSQLRWLGPEKGIIHMAAAALINAVWDLWAKSEGKPLWELLADMSPEQIVRCIDFRYLTDVLTPAEAHELLDQQWDSRERRKQQLLSQGYPAYTTSAGWIGYSDDQLVRLLRQATEDGWDALKMKVGSDLQRDRERLAIVRREVGDDVTLMLDANQVWDVPEAIDWVRRLAEFNPIWIEEPTCPDDILGHAAIARAIAPIGVATGEMAQNRVAFKQLLQANAMQYCQLDSCRLGGVNEVLAVLLMAAKFEVPVCPHGGGVGLCEQIQHLSMFDFVCVSGRWDGRWTEYVDHLHDQFVDPVVVDKGRYQTPRTPGYSTQMKLAG